MIYYQNIQTKGNKQLLDWIQRFWGWCNTIWIGWATKFGEGIERGWLREWANYVPTNIWTSWATLIQQVAIDHIDNKIFCHKLNFSPQQQKSHPFKSCLLTSCSTKKNGNDWALDF